MVLFGFLVFIIPAVNLISTIVEFFKPGCFDVKLNIDENLGNYFEALEESDKKTMISEEENLRKNYVRTSHFVNNSIGYEDFG